MSLETLLSAMFPGDEARGVPGFSTLRVDTKSFGNPTLLSELELALDALRWPEDTDVNDVLRRLRKSHPEIAQDFIDAALETYFTAPEVIRALRGGAETLFPHARALPDMDYDLLAPVLGRATAEGLE